MNVTSGVREPKDGVMMRLLETVFVLPRLELEAVFSDQTVRVTVGRTTIKPSTDDSVVVAFAKGNEFEVLNTGPQLVSRARQGDRFAGAPRCARRGRSLARVRRVHVRNSSRQVTAANK